MTNDEKAADAAEPAAVDEATKTEAPENDSEATSEDESSTNEDESSDGEKKAKDKEFGRRQLSVSVRSLMVAAVITILVAAVGVLGWLYVGARSKLDEQARQSENDVRAEKVALDYAVNAAVMDFKDLGPWKQNLVKGTTPELKKKLTEAATAMEQILLPLQWSSTAKPLAAKMRSHDNGLYVVDAFVSVMTKTVQATENLQSTATYSITINSADGWLISDVGGIAAVVGDK